MKKSHSRDAKTQLATLEPPGWTEYNPGKGKANMGARPRKVLNEALGLTDEERAELAARLIDSLDRKCDEDARSAWDTEIEKRIHELENGTVAAVPWPEARRQIMRSRNGADTD